MKYQIGDVVFVNDTKSLLGKVITAYNLYEFGQSNATHVFIISNIIDENTVEICEAGSNGVSIYLTGITDTYLTTSKVKRSTVPLVLVHEIAKKYEGKPYGWDSYIALIFRLTGQKLKLNLGPSSEICSELVARVLYECSNKQIDFEKEYPNYDFDEICPEQIFESKFLEEITV